MENKLISKELTWQGLKMELSINEINNICQKQYEQDKYYNHNILMIGLHKVLNKEIDFQYFSSWCVLVANCFCYTNYKNNKLNSLMDTISYYFDGISFDEEWNEKQIYNYIANLKYYNHIFNDIKNSTKTRFETNGIERILVFDHVNLTTDSCVLRAIVKDNNRKEFDLKYVDETYFVYDEKINYSFVDNRTFKNIFNSFYDGNENWKENHKLIF